MSIGDNAQRIEIGGVFRETVDVLRATVAPTLLITASVLVAGVAGVALVGGGFWASDLETGRFGPLIGGGVAGAVVFSCGTLVGIGALNALYMAQLRGRSMTSSAAFSKGIRRSPTLFVAMLVVGIITTIGTFMCCVPGVIFALGMLVVNALVVEEDAGVYEAIDSSWKLLDGHKADAFLVMLAWWVFEVSASAMLGLFVPEVDGAGIADTDPSTYEIIAALAPSIAVQLLQWSFSLIALPMRTALVCVICARRLGPAPRSLDDGVVQVFG